MEAVRAIAREKLSNEDELEVDEEGEEDEEDEDEDEDEDGLLVVREVNHIEAEEDEDEEDEDEDEDRLLVVREVNHMMKLKTSVLTAAFATKKGVAELPSGNSKGVAFKLMGKKKSLGTIASFRSDPEQKGKDEIGIDGATEVEEWEDGCGDERLDVVSAAFATATVSLAFKKMMPTVEGEGKSSAEHTHTHTLHEFIF